MVKDTNFSVLAYGAPSQEWPQGSGVRQLGRRSAACMQMPSMVAAQGAHTPCRPYTHPAFSTGVPRGDIHLRQCWHLGPNHKQPALPVQASRESRHLPALGGAQGDVRLSDGQQQAWRGGQYDSFAAARDAASQTEECIHLLAVQEEWV